MAVVNRWEMPFCKDCILIAEHEISNAKMTEWGYKNKQFLFYAYRTKPASGKYVAVNRWVNALPAGSKCKDFTLSVAEHELTDAQLTSWGYASKMTQFYVPDPRVRILNAGVLGQYGNYGGPTAPLTGFVDMHTHPMSKWGFGEELFYGDVDGNPSDALGSCSCLHNFVVCPFDGSCCSGFSNKQNQYRNKIVDQIDEKWGAPIHQKTAGFPGFAAWPKHNSVTHQQMYVDWIKRAYEGGLRVMVALAVNSHCLADAAETAGHNDDLNSTNVQIQKLIEFVTRHDEPQENGFMEIAYTSADLKRIVRQNKLAIIIGMETDNIGNFYNPVDKKGATFNPKPSEQDVRNEIDRLFDLGVRYIFPIHLTNNAFGGTAIYESGLNVANKYNTQEAFTPEVVDSRSTAITFKLVNPYNDLGFWGRLFMSLTGDVIGGNTMPKDYKNYPDYKDPGLNKSHRNSLGLSDLGRMAVKYMMQKGMMIDIDHMSERSADEVVYYGISYGYPINSGHNGLRGNGGTENSRTVFQYQTIQNLGGMIGLGHGGGATNFVNAYRSVAQLVKNKQVCIGTDANGFYPLPGPPVPNERISYDANLTPCTMGTKTWDFNTDGFAHYGLFPDYIKSWEAAGMTAKEKEAFFSSAEDFFQMWKKCEQRKSQVR
ncbi:MAG: membrane dipeptidase [Saprospiraceae bacterium]|nr:membrane dipeptidase [Saprospiraceae bacterium]